MRRLVLLCLLAALSGCGGSSAPGSAVDDPVASPQPPGSISEPALKAKLLQASDLPGLPAMRAFATAQLTTQATPQLALCRGTAPVGEHQLANVIAGSDEPGRVKVFEIVSAYQNESAAMAAYDMALADARACTTYTADGAAHRVTKLAAVDLGVGVDGMHYALVTSDVVSGDVRTLARKGTFLVLVSGFGKPPTAQPLLSYQADVMRKALARLG